MNDPKEKSDEQIINHNDLVVSKESDMKFETFRRTPQNPNHFVALCMGMLRESPQLAKTSGSFLKQVSEIKGRAIFRCAYGYFWATTDRYCSKEFFPDRESCIENLKTKRS